MYLAHSNPVSKPRVEAIDVLRGLVMLLMALDHTRDFFSNFAYKTTDLQHTTVALFFTRWISNFCAPVFITLVGTSMAIVIFRGKSKQAVSLFLLTRGLWMSVAGLTLISYVWIFSFDPSVITFQVISVIGIGMMCLSALIFLPNWSILFISLIFIIGHNLLDGHEAAIFGSLSWLHVPFTPVTFHFISPVTLHMDYAIIPWVMLPALGYVFGFIYAWPQQKRMQCLFALGLFCCISFISLRYMNYYGDPDLWSPQKNSMFTLMSFLKCTKYPPSLLYLLMTLGPACFALILFELMHNRLTQVLSLFGKVPFFFYITHIALIHLLAVSVAYFRFGQASVFFGNDIYRFDANMAAYGYSLPIVYLITVCIILSLYPLCAWYAGLKQRHRQNLLLSYI